MPTPHTACVCCAAGIVQAIVPNTLGTPRAAEVGNYEFKTELATQHMLPPQSYEAVGTGGGPGWQSPVVTAPSGKCSAGGLTTEATACILCEPGQYVPVLQDATCVQNFCPRGAYVDGFVCCLAKEADCPESWPESAAVACWHFFCKVCRGCNSVLRKKYMISMVQSLQVPEALCQSILCPAVQ